MELKNGMKVIAPEGCETYLTAGKEYQIIYEPRKNTYFEIKDDTGFILYCMMPFDGHSRCNNWTIKQEQPKVSIIDKIDLLLDVAQDVDNTFFAIKLRHLKQELQELEKNTPNDMELGAEIRKLLKQ